MLHCSLPRADPIGFRRATSVISYSGGPEILHCHICCIAIMQPSLRSQTGAPLLFISTTLIADTSPRGCHVKPLLYAFTDTWQESYDFAVTALSRLRGDDP